MKYLISLDIDGTILNHQGHLSLSTKHTIRHLKNQGHIVMLATGRPLTGAMPIYHELDLDTPIITDNGSCIDHPKNHQFSTQRTYMSVDIMHALFKHVKAHLNCAFFNIEDKVYAYRYNAKLERIFSGLSQDIVIEKNLDEIYERPTGLIFLMKPRKKHVLESYIQMHFANTIAYRLWGEDHESAVYEIYLKHVSKASAIKYVLDYFGISQEHWISFGDGINDIEMIKEAGHGVAMKNAHRDLLKYAKHVTQLTNDEDGVAQYLTDYLKLVITNE
jgi:5-amino-6-(5-phospho-D-ribitylamino)uracil phosphatase